MWLLTCDGDLFEGKRIWLRPGSTHLLGRTTGRPEVGERIQYINNKSVSRKHLTIEVDLPKPGDSSKIHTRSKIKVTDGSKIGTTVNGDKFSQETKVLDGKEYTIKLGHYEHLFHLFWHPVTLSFPGSSSKKKGDGYAAVKERLEQTDIKLINEYVSNETTHAIAKKRNTPAALQALLQARWVVTDGFADALANAVGRSSADGTSLLEERFDGNWPNEENYLVPTGTEPRPRPDDVLIPNLSRAEVFHNYVFVFLTQSQFDNLLPVITTGGGKALLWEVELGVSQVEEVVEHVKEVAGHKGPNQFQLSQQSGKGGVVVVRMDYSGDEALHKFVKDIDLALGQRSVQQNEFLDAILTVNAIELRQPLPEAGQRSAVGGQSRVSDSQPQIQPAQQTQPAVIRQRSVSPSVRAASRVRPAPEDEEGRQEEEASEQPQTATKRRNRRFITQSRFKGFDDFDPSQFSKPAEQSPPPSFEDPEQIQAQITRDMDVGASPNPTQTQHNTRKRPAPTHEEDEENMYAQILTAHGAAKRQKTAAAQNGQGASTSKPANASTSAAAQPEKKQKQLDVMAEVKARRQKEEERRQQDEEYLRNALDGIDINELKNLAEVEQMDLPARDRPTRQPGENGQSDRWDPAWNGRKNFKKFRAQGQHNDGPRLQRVIVTLQEVPRKGHGIGDEYWLTSSSTNRSKSKSQSQSQSQRRAGASRSQHEDGDDGEDAQRFRRRLQSSREEDDEDAAVEQVLPEEIAGHARDEGLQAVAAANAVNSTPSQTFGTESQRRAAGKRPATQQAASAPAAKKAKQTHLAAPTRESMTLDDDDDDDGLKFRRRRK